MVNRRKRSGTSRGASPGKEPTHSRGAPPGAPPGTPRARPTPRAATLTATVLLAGIVAAGFFALARRGALGGGGVNGARVELPPPSAPPVDTAIRFADFLGSNACADCHRPQFQAWAGSVHSRAGGAPGEALIIARFNGSPIRFKDAIVTPRASGGAFTFTVARQGQPPTILRVDGVIGGGHMTGGGTQGFVSRFSDGTLRFLPFDFIRKEDAWFCNTSSRANHGWVMITPTMSIAECGDWPPTRVLGDETRFANCQGCHGSQITVAFDTTTHRYNTRFTSLAINCESCHGPGREHVTLVRAGATSASATSAGATSAAANAAGGNADRAPTIAGASVHIGMRPLATLTKDASIEVCSQCHALKDQVKPGYLAGKDLAAYYSTSFPLLGDEPFFADGRVRTFAYQQGHLYSDCYRNGSLTCVSCHDPHTQRYRDINGVALQGRTSDGQCTSCHASKAEPLEEHTRHARESPGSRCVNCHMPYLQHPELGTALRFARSDHTIPIPRPAFDASLGVPNACGTCHTDRDPADLQAQVAKWWGALKPHPEVVTRLVDARDGSAEKAMAALLAPAPNHEIGRFAALARYVESALAPDVPSLDGQVRERLREMTRDGELDIKSMALAALHFARGEERDARLLLAEVLRSLGANDEPVRRRWVLVLGYLGDRARARGDHVTAVTSYRKALEILPDDPRVLASAALAHGDAGDPGAAVQLFRRSLERDPVQPLTLVNLGNALLAQGNVDAAVAAYRRALELNPREPLATFNLANVSLRQGDAARAIDLYTTTVALDPSLSAAHFNLARAYVLQGNAPLARAALQRGLEFDPRSEEGRQLLATLDQAMRGAR